jgi:hypothetical protein
MRISENWIQVVARKRHCRAVSGYVAKYGGNKVLEKVSKFHGFRVSWLGSCQRDVLALKH